MVFGECWLSVEGVPEPIRGNASDCLLLPSGRPFRVGSDLGLQPVDALTLFSDAGNGGITTHNGGGDFLGIGGHFTLAGDHASLLVGVLPPILHIRKESDKAVLRWTLDRLRQELREPQPGGFLVAQQLATMLLVQALRVHLAEGANGGVGWLFALADRRMRLAIAAMHDDPAYRWTLQALAKRAGMSRTTFAVKFKETAGKSPMDYLTHWRMLLAKNRLANSGDPIRSLLSRSAMNPIALSAQPSKGVWAVPQGNTAVGAIPRRLKPPSRPYTAIRWNGPPLGSSLIHRSANVHHILIVSRSALRAAHSPSSFSLAVVRLMARAKVQFYQRGRVAEAGAYVLA